ncbi:MAG: hypothetical protein WDZ84_07160 [Rhodovibrionaceae bacterium]
MPHPFSFRSQDSRSPLLPASLLDRAEGPSSLITPPHRRPGREEIAHRIAARRRREARENQGTATGAAHAEPVPAPLDEEIQLYNRNLAQQIADARRSDGIAPILKNALEHEPESAGPQVDHLLGELRQRAPEQAEKLGRELGRNASPGKNGGGATQLRVPPPESGRTRKGEFYRGADEAIEDFIDFAKEQGLYELLPSHTREALDTALDAATLLPGPGKILVLAEFATLIAPAVGHILEGDFDAAAQATTDAMIFLPAAMIAGRRGGKLAVAGSRHFRTGGELPSPTPLVAGAGITQLADGNFQERLVSAMPRYDIIEPQPSGPPPFIAPDPKEQAQILVNVPPDLEDLLTQIPPTPGFTPADKDDIVEIFPDQRDEIPQIFVVDYKGSPFLQGINTQVGNLAKDLGKKLGVPVRFTGGGEKKKEAYRYNRINKAEGRNRRKGSSLIDVTLEHKITGCFLHINTTDTYVDRITSDSREMNAAVRILRNEEKCRILVLVPKPKPGERLDTNALERFLGTILKELDKMPEKKYPIYHEVDPTEIRHFRVPPIKG